MNLWEFERLPPELLPLILTFLDPVQLTEARIVNTKWRLALPIQLCHVHLQESFLSNFRGKAIKLNSTLVYQTIRDKFNERLTLILTEPLEDIDSQFVWLTDPKLNTLNVNQLVHCITHVNEGSCFAHLVWLASHSLKDVKAIVKSFYADDASRIMDQYRDILVSNLSLVELAEI